MRAVGWKGLGFGVQGLFCYEVCWGLAEASEQVRRRRRVVDKKAKTLTGMAQTRTPSPP